MEKDAFLCPTPRESRVGEQLNAAAVNRFIWVNNNAMPVTV